MASYWLLHCNQSFDARVPDRRSPTTGTDHLSMSKISNKRQGRLSVALMVLCSLPGRQNEDPRCSFCTCAPGSIACLPSCLVCRQRQNQLLQKEQMGLSGRYQTHSFPKRPFVTKHHKSRQLIFLSVQNTIRTEGTAEQGLHATSQACKRTRVMASRFRILFFFG